MNQARDTRYPEINALIERGLIACDGDAYKDPAGNTLFTAGYNGTLQVNAGGEGQTFDYIPPYFRDEPYRERLRGGRADDTALLYFNAPRGYHPGHSSLGIHQRQGRDRETDSEFNFVTDLDAKGSLHFLSRVVTLGGAGTFASGAAQFAPGGSLWNVALGGAAGALAAISIPLKGKLKEENFAAKHAIGIPITAAQSEVLKTDLLLQKLDPPRYSLLNVGTGVNCALHSLNALDDVGIPRKDVLAYKPGWAVISPGSLERFVSPMRDSDPITLTVRAKEQEQAKFELRSKRVGDRDYMALDVLSGPYTAAEGIALLKDVGIKLIGARFYQHGQELQPGERLALDVLPRDKSLINKMISSSLGR